MKRTLLARMRNEGGSAMTEFVITLPIFIMIFAGMGMLYRYSHEGMVARMKTNKILVANATAPNNIAGFVPGIGGTVSIQNFGDIVVNGSGALGMYYDSYIKAGLAETIVPGTIIKNPASPPKNNIEAITGMPGTAAADSWTNMLMNDLATPQWDGSGWANILMSIVATIGVSPSGAAGIRYLPIQAQTSHSFTHSWGGGATYDPGMLQLASPTAAHHRVVAVAASRIAMNTLEPFQECALEFDIPLCTGIASANTQDVVETNTAANACDAQSQVWQGCMNSCGANPPSWPTFPNGIIPCTNCRCQCESEEPPSSCADVGNNLDDFSDNIPGCSSNPSMCQQTF